MPVTNVSHDIDALTLTITAEFAAPRARIWQIYADPRQLEKIWVRRRTRRRWSTTSSLPAVGSPTT